LRVLLISLFVYLLKRLRADEQIGMDNKNRLSTPAATITVNLTNAGRIALAVDALEAAGKTRNEQRRRALCEQAMSYLRPVVQA
jgi:hypothetical protein